MSLRTLLRESSHFLVQYHIDDTLTVRSSGFIKHIGEKKAAVIRRSQQPMPSYPVDQDDQVHQDIVTSAVTYTTLTPIQSTTSQPDLPVNTPSLNPFMSTFSHPDHQATLSSVTISSTNPFSNQSPTNQQLSLFNPFLDSSPTSTNPFVNTSQPTYDQQYSSFNSPTVNPFLSTNQPFQHSSQANHSQSAFTPVKPINSPSHLPDTFRYPEPTTPTTPFPSDVQDRLTPVNRRPLTDRKFDGVYQRLATLEKKQTEIKKKPASHNVFVIHSHSSPARKQFNTALYPLPMPAHSNKSRDISIFRYPRGV